MRANKQGAHVMTKRAAIYARFSTDLQNERSIEDQVTLCRKHAGEHNLTVVATYEDRARSGASVFGREGLVQLMDAARDGAFDVVVIEALDRLSRDMEDLAGIHKRLSFLNIEIRAVHDGVANTVLVGLRGLVGQLYREDNAHKIRRGQAGRVGQGLNAGGLTFGYAPVPGEPGKRQIVEEEAEIIRRIFEEYVSGRTPRDIARDLNRDDVTPPRGTKWNASTINGNVQRGTGILQNELYGGRLVWNKVRMVKDPDTGRRVSRPNPKEEWQSSDVPELAIVSRDLFEQAQARKRERSVDHPHHHRRPRHMLSGLLRCGACGSGMSTNGKDKSGRVRIRCSAATESGACPDPKTFYLETVETAVLARLRAEMKSPKVLAEYVKTYHEERKRLSAEADANRTRLERRADKLKREIDRLVDHLAKGIGDPYIIGPRSTELYHERQAVLAELEKAPPAFEVVSLHPAILKRYEEQLESLQDALAEGMRSGDRECAEAIRELVETVTIYRDPSEPGAVEIEIAGRLNSILGDRAYPNGVKRVWGLMVAEEGLEPPTRGL
ncbi:recombinase family protein [Stappia indica]|uniref:recombinase family protein n=1 Tax=Stappia indica TaxID=538381 RepID=UPI00313448C4